MTLAKLDQLRLAIWPMRFHIGQFSYFALKMSNKKKLSHEEKRSRLLEFFHEKKDVYLLKDLEKLVPKAKGLPMQTVKEILNSLVGDDLVDTDKIGTSTYFWAFPSKSYNNKLNECGKLEALIEELKTQEANLDKEIETMTASATEDQSGLEYRAKVLEELAKLEQEKRDILEKLDKFKDFDPENFEQFKKDCDMSREAVDRWTDNVFSIKSWCKKKFFMEDSEINKSLGIPANFDYYED